MCVRGRKWHVCVCECARAHASAYACRSSIIFFVLHTLLCHQNFISLENSDRLPAFATHPPDKILQNIAETPSISLSLLLSSPDPSLVAMASITHSRLTHEGPRLVLPAQGLAHRSWTKEMARWWEWWVGRRKGEYCSNWSSNPQRLN